MSGCNRARVRRGRRAAALVLVGLLAGCGYRFAGTDRSFAPDLRTIGIASLVNETREHGIEKRLALAIEREFAIRGPLRVAPTADEADLLLSGRVHTAMDRPVAFNREDEVLIYQTTLVLDLELRRRDTGAIVWEARDLRGVEDYESVPSVIVTTSSGFRGGTLNAEDLGGFTDVQLAESRRRRSLDRIVATLAENAYTQIMEDF